MGSFLPLRASSKCNEDGWYDMGCPAEQDGKSAKLLARAGYPSTISQAAPATQPFATLNLPMQSIPEDERTAAIAGAMDPPSFGQKNDEDDNEEVYIDSLDGAGAQSLASSTWAFVWSNTSAAARQQDKEEAEEAEGVAATAAAAAVAAVPQGQDGDGSRDKGGGRDGSITAAEGLRRRLGMFRAPRPPGGSDDENGGGRGGGTKQSGEGKEDEVEDEATSSNYSDLKRGKRFKKLTKLLLSAQVRSSGAYECGARLSPS